MAIIKYLWYTRYTVNRMKVVMRKISIRKTFNIISIIFLTTCVVVYGFRFLTLFIKNNKKMSIESNTLGKRLKTENKDTLEKIDGTLYFKGAVENNYVTYSGALWRAIKIEEDNSVVLISEDALTVLANGEELDYDNSHITEWLNKTEKENSGILQKSMNNYNEYLLKGAVCNDRVDSVSNSKCEDINEKYYFNTLTMADYVNTGANEGFINNGEEFYLSDFTKDDYIWYVDKEGKVTKNNGAEILGIRPVIKLKSNAPLVNGSGTKDDPYKFDSTKNIIGAYVKLGNDNWRVIGADGDNIKLSYDGYLMENGEPLKYKFSVRDAYYDESILYSTAYYLNKDFYNSLSYKDIIVKTAYPRGYYGSSNNYDYIESMEETIEANVGIMSIGDIIYNHELSDYFIINPSSTRSTFVYTYNEGTLYTKAFSSYAKLVPVITINKTSLMGTGEKDDPYRLGDNNEKKA